MRQIVVSGGAGYWAGPAGLALDEYVLDLTGQNRPKVCAVSTASGDNADYIESFMDTMAGRCRVTHLPLFRPPFVDPERLLLNQDVIYVGGGNTVSLLAVWRAHGVDRLLRAALDRGVILYGSSAGGMCWFESGMTDSIGWDGQLRPLTEGLGFLSGSHSPHFDRPGRRDAYSVMVGTGRLVDGLGIDDFAAVRFVEGAVHDVVSAVPDATAYRVTRGEAGELSVVALPARRLD